MMLLKPAYETEYGVERKTYPEIEQGELFYGSFRSFGGTDTVVNGLYSIENTATIDTWFRPDITSDCRIGLPETGQVYEIKGMPENISMRNQYLRIRVTEVREGA